MMLYKIYHRLVFVKFFQNMNIQENNDDTLPPCDFIPLHKTTHYHAGNTPYAWYPLINNKYIYVSYDFLSHVVLSRYIHHNNAMFMFIFSTTTT